MAAGWTITEAIEAIVDEGLLAEWKEARAERESLLTPSGGAVPGGDGDPGDIHIDKGEAIHRKRLATTDGELAHTRRAVFDDLKDLMRSGRLVALGRAGSVTEPRKQIEESQWVALTEFDEAGSSVSDANGNGFCGVTIYPILEAPEAAALIEPCTLASALEEYVLSDPEVSSRIKGAKGGPPANLRDVVGSLGDGRCLIHLTDDASAIEKDLISLQEPFGGWLWHHTHAIRVKTLASRLAALGGLLIRGELAALGVEDGDEEERTIEIGREELRKPSTRFCLASGDIWQAGDTPHRSFHAVRIEPASNAARLPIRANVGGRPPADYEDAVIAVVRKAFRGELKGNIAKTASLVEEVRESLPSTKHRPAADTVARELRGNPLFRVVWKAARSGE